MTEWKTYRLGDVCSRLRSGKGIPASEVSACGKFAVVGGNGVRGYTDTSNFNGQCVVVGRQGAYCGNVRYFDGEFYMTEHAVVIVGNELADTHFLAYLLSTMHLGQLSAQSAQPGLSVQTLSKLEISLPSLEEQRRIAGILGAIDDKIENNRRINTNLELQAQALYKQWFVDNRNDDWETKPLSEIITIYDSQRKPLSGQQREKMNKVYPYYGAASLMDYVDGYLFDGIYLLLGEDGTVVDELGFPILQYVWGKFWVNNHAHILTGKNGFSTETLYVLLKQTSVKSIVTGAVQPKISQANLKNISVTIPPIHQLSKYNEVIEPLFKTIRKNNDESSRLATLRDTLLPKLMNGEIKI